MKNINQILYLMSKFIDLVQVEKLQVKFSKLADLLQWEQQAKKEKVTAHSLPGYGPDVETGVVRPWKKLPNIRDFALKISAWDWLFLLFGLEKRLTPEMEFWGWKNSEANQYINYMFDRLKKEVELELYDEAKDTIWKLMNSSAYLSSCYNHVVRNWHRKRPMIQNEKWIKEIKKLITEKATNLEYERVYLDEITKLRPLGVPTVPWRVYLHMYNNLLTQWRLVTEGNVQHGYLPGRGVVTAWEALVKKLDSPNIFEADFKGFFDNVTHFGIAKVLKDSLGMPSSEIDFLTSVNKSLVNLPQVLKLKEPHAEYQEIKRRQEWASYKDLYKTAAESYGLFCGVPQGAPTSCGLATLALRPMIEEVDCVLYADDGLYFPKEFKRVLRPLNRPDMGVEVNRRKTRILKEDGIWLVESFVFLGIRYFPPVKKSFQDFPYFPKVVSKWLNLEYTTTERFEASTRKGATLSFSLRESFLSFLSKARDGMLQFDGSAGKEYHMSRPLREWLAYSGLQWLNIKSKPKLLWNNRLTGWFTARMFIGSWTDKVKQDFSLTYTKNSWMDIRWEEYAKSNNLDPRNVTVFTASSFASHDLMRMIDYPFKYKKKRNFRKVHSWTARQQERC
jgi:hypothetical protein